MSTFWHNERVPDVHLPQRPDDRDAQIQRLQEEMARLRDALARDEHERDRLKRRNEQLKDQLDAARRAGFRQAAPFAKPHRQGTGWPASGGEVRSSRYATAIAKTPIDAFISTRKQTHGERPGPCRRGPLPTTATRVDRMTRKLHTKAGAAV